MDEVLENHKNGEQANEAGENWQETMKDVEFAGDKVAGNDGEKERTSQVGEVYGEIAKAALRKWNGLSEEEASKKVSNSTFEELEGMIGASGSIKAACESIVKKLDLLDAEDFTAAVLHGEDLTPDEDGDYWSEFEEARESVKYAKFNEEFVDEGSESEKNKEKFVLDILSDVHDKWCADNEKKFFDEKRADKQYQFLKLELIGFKDATADLIFVEPILRKIGIEVDLANLEEQYGDYPYEIGADAEELSDGFYYTGGDDGSIPLGGDFAEGLFANPSLYLSNGASKEIGDSIRKDFEIAAEITKQLGEQRFYGEQVDLDALSVYHEEGKEGVEKYWLNKYNRSNEDIDPWHTSDDWINDGWN